MSEANHFPSASHSIFPRDREATVPFFGGSVSNIELAPSSYLEIFRSLIASLPIKPVL